MNLIDLLLLSIGLAMDCFAVSMACGAALKRTKHTVLHTSLRIGFAFGTFQALMPLLGWIIGCRFRTIVENYDHWIAFFILTILGGKMIYENFQHSDNEKTLDPTQTTTVLTMAIATSIDALAVGFTFAFLNINLWTSLFIIGFTSFAFALFGIFIGHKYSHYLRIPAEQFGGMVLVGIGTKILLEHLFF